MCPSYMLIPILIPNTYTHGAMLICAREEQDTKLCFGGVSMLVISTGTGPEMYNNKTYTGFYQKPQ